VYITTDEVANQHVPESLGAKTVAKIREYIKTGQMKAAETAKEWLAEDARQEKTKKLTPDQAALAAFEGVFNVGVPTAKRWLKEYNKQPVGKRLSPLKWVKANADGLPAPPRGKVRPLSHAQLVGLKYYKDLQKRIPRRYIDIVQMIIRLALAKKFGIDSYKLAVAGSYRRGAPDSGDIDIIFTSRKFNLAQAVEVLEEWGIIVATMSQKEHKFTGVCHCPSGQWYYFHLDLVYTTEKAWDAALLWFTGSKGFNTKTRNKAKKLGLVLNQYGLFKRDDTQRKNPVALTEKKMLKTLGVPYVPPECR
jgi:DNA polymerase/3'-5' exonuclease PolX